MEQKDGMRMNKIKTDKIKLLLIEDNRLLRDGLLGMLKGHPDIRVIASSGDGENTILKIHELQPDVILLDLGLRSQNSLRVVEIVKMKFPKANVIVMDLAPTQGDVLQFVKAGASGFILKDATLDEFLSTIRSVAQGGRVLPSGLSGSLFTQIIESAVKLGNGSLKKAIRLTKRELEVVALISDGLSNKEISTRLHVATYTIKSHVHNIMEKLALHTRLEVANYALSDGTAMNDIVDTISMLDN